MSNWKTYGFQNETKNWLNAVAVTGSNVSYDTAQIVNGFVENCKASGIWDNLVDVGIFVGNDLNAALTKLKWHPVAGPYLTNVSGNFTAGSYTERGAAGGLSGNGTNQWLDSRVPANIMQPAPHLSFYLTNPAFAGGASRGYIGSERAGNSDSLILGYLGGGAAQQFRYGTGAGTQASFTTSSAPGFFVGNFNTSLSRDELFISGLLRGGTTTISSTPVPYNSSNLTLFSVLSAGSPSLYLPATCTFYSIGTSLTPIQQTGFFNIVQSLQLALGRAVT